MIELKGVSKKYGVGSGKINALRGIDLTIPQGDFLSIVGASGSGKTTLMNIIGCLDTPNSGTYRLDGEETSSLDRNSLARIRNRKIGFVFQHFNLLSRLTALENVEMPLMFRGIPAQVRRHAAEAAMDKVGLSHRLTHTPNELSGGQQQRVAIARAIVTEPSVILADEPTGNLDSTSGADILELLTLLNNRGTTVVLITHDVSVASRCSSAVRITDGQINTTI